MEEKQGLEIKFPKGVPKPELLQKCLKIRGVKTTIFKGDLKTKMVKPLNKFTSPHKRFNPLESPKWGLLYPWCSKNSCLKMVPKSKMVETLNTFKNRNHFSEPPEMGIPVSLEVPKLPSLKGVPSLRVWNH